jgi:hypothetical protein
MASPKACGQAITRTVTARATANVMSSEPKTAARSLSFLHEAHDLTQRRLVSGTSDGDGQRPLPVDGAGNDLVALFAVHRPGLPGEKRLIERGRSLDDVAVGRHLLAGTDQNVVALAQFDNGYIGDAAVAADPMGNIGNHGGQVIEGCTRRHHRPHLDPVSQQHHVEKGGQLPVERLAVETE